MLFSNIVIAFIPFATMVHAGWINDLQPRASGTPQSCTTTCPSKDNLNRSYYQTWTGSGFRFCQYAISTGVYYTCLYDQVTGNYLSGTTTCPASIPVTCPSKRSLATKRNQLAAKPQPAAIPVNMRSLAGLKKSKLAARALKDREMADLMEEESL
ncbi:hypothetical protein FRB94_002200 [Tulasnella sp. JGI-2019a]|nr:hypothetical protein FRB93_003933 [Tulasnella sp. JGI-2019a]KAG9004660.1 hypothetical protein FRB94_002200 [Tulasnella sp. JGI-2019a]KAG9024488.1 hypothetical protein FRB95_011446 [Tulasnella sp. JGI-2019a]